MSNNNKTNEAKLIKTEKTWKRKSQWWNDFGENEIPGLNSLKPFEFEPKANIDGYWQ